ncbi:DUF2608 domain-containing protein [Defluviimonas salinarum]|uniref:DUF2608 domain-containing protein n=1 Tax=Defluviimonas salinarum TaxID=2992147 RepID=A0ABT3J4H1_9RHOB|nr:DUF2608 domain-containing protein [Defluviimonas salinarum]MCW3782566.1 DUF2608 domain-containing protein [Defluviimonas salinarum]
MSSLNETESVRLDLDTDFRARVLLEVGMRCPHQFSRNGRTFPAGTAFLSQVLVRDLLKLGLFSLNIHSMAGLDERASGMPVSFARIPSSLLGIGLHYAIDVAPRDPDSPDGAPVVLIDDLERHVQRIEAHFGPVDIDMGLVARVAQCAHDATAVPEAAAEGGYAG